MKNRTQRLNRRQAITYELLRDGFPVREYGSKTTMQRIAKEASRDEQRLGHHVRFTARAYR